MQHLDAILAFVLTLAALATVVTIIMETLQRIFRMRRRNLVQLMKLLNDELGKAGPLGLSEQDRWDFIKGVISNPAMTFSKTAGAELGKGRTLKQALDSIGWGALSAATYDKVTLEHVLRRLADLPTVQQLSLKSADVVKVELNLLARKFEEIGSGISAKFKAKARVLTMFFGILFALGANVDGYRIFTAFLADASLTGSVIAMQEDLSESARQSQDRTAGLEDLAGKVEAAERALAADPDNASLQQALAEAEVALEAEATPEAIRESAARAQAVLQDLTALGLPIGWLRYPACPFGESNEEAWLAYEAGCVSVLEQNRDCILGRSAAGEGCDAWYFAEGQHRPFVHRIVATLIVDIPEAIRWLIVVVGTGVLIGLGAPFWFDVAKRLSQVRQMFNGSGSSEVRMSGNDANGNAKLRKAIVDNVVNDAKSAAKARKNQSGSP